jgi:hypothetical protein
VISSLLEHPAPEHMCDMVYFENAARKSRQTGAWNLCFDGEGESRIIFQEGDHCYVRGGARGEAKGIRLGHGAQVRGQLLL